MIHTEHLRNASEVIEIRTNGIHAIHAYIEDEECILFPSVHDFSKYVYAGELTERTYCTERQ